jgi:hypothetical protein
MSLTINEFKDVVALHIDVLNSALDGLPPERLRLHLCWGNYEGPHHHDVPLREILPLVLKAREVLHPHMDCAVYIQRLRTDGLTADRGRSAGCPGKD